LCDVAAGELALVERRAVRRLMHIDISMHRRRFWPTRSAGGPILLTRSDGTE